MATVDDLPFLDIEASDFSMDAPVVHEAREHGPYARTPYGLAVLRYGEVDALINDKRLIQGSAQWGHHNNIPEPWTSWWERIVLNREGQDHVRMRKLVNPAFSSKHIAGLVPYFQVLANELIDAFVDRGHCEFMREFAEPYATRVISRLLGLDEAEWETLARYSEHVGLALSVEGKHRVDEINAGLEGLLAYADGLIEERRAQPRDDFVMTLIEANEDSDRLSDIELRETIALLVFGGIDTTRNQLGLGIDLFIRHPDQWALLAERPDLAANAVEEVMRMRPTTTWVTREAAVDFELDGIPVAKGTTIHLLTEPSGTDPRAFPDPGFDITAEGRKKHFGFGGGRHYCLGHFIARGDMTEAFKLLSRRLPGIRYDGEPEFLPNSGNTGPVTLPIGFDHV